MAKKPVVAISTNVYPESELEVHPFAPFVDETTRLLIMGTFPPPKNRWSMDFYYPNRINDFWYMMGLIFRGDRNAFYDRERRTFRLEEIKNLLREKHIGLNDTGYKVYRQKGNASDKYLEIIEPIPLYQLCRKYPSIRAVSTTGEKAASVIAEITGTEVPKIGEMVKDSDGLSIWRMPSTSRAYPLPLEKKASFYAKMFKYEGIDC